MRTELTAKDRGFPRAIGAAEVEVQPQPAAAAIDEQLKKIEAVYMAHIEALKSRAGYWRGFAFICFSGNVVMTAGIVIFLTWVATR